MEGLKYGNSRNHGEFYCYHLLQACVRVRVRVYQCFITKKWQTVPTILSYNLE